jgi:hypothetical protein
MVVTSRDRSLFVTSLAFLRGVFVGFDHGLDERRLTAAGFDRVEGRCLGPWVVLKSGNAFGAGVVGAVGRIVPLELITGTGTSLAPSRLKHVASSERVPFFRLRIGGGGRGVEPVGAGSPVLGIGQPLAQIAAKMVKRRIGEDGCFAEDDRRFGERNPGATACVLGADWYREGMVKSKDADE